MSSRHWLSWAWPQTILYALYDAGVSVWHRENLVQHHHQRLGLLYLLGGMGLGWWAYTITPDVLSVLRFGTVGVVQFTTRILSLAASCKKRSMRELECSGPCPSYPCGKSITNDGVCCHFELPETMNWSTITCAEFAKSPNCASQSTSTSVACMEYPYSNPNAAFSDNGLLCISNDALAEGICLNGQYTFPELGS